MSKLQGISGYVCLTNLKTGEFEKHGNWEFDGQQNYEEFIYNRIKEIGYCRIDNLTDSEDGLSWVINDSWEYKGDAMKITMSDIEYNYIPESGVPYETALEIFNDAVMVDGGFEIDRESTMKKADGIFDWDLFRTNWTCQTHLTLEEVIRCSDDTKDGLGCNDDPCGHCPYAR